MAIKQCINWLWGNLSGIRFRIALSSIVGIVDVCLGLFFVWICKQLIDIATRSIDGNMKFFIILFVVTISLQIFLSLWKAYLEHKTEILFKNKQRYSLFSQLMFSSWNGKDSFHSGDAINRLEEDVRIVSEGVCKSMPSVITTVFQFFAAFLFLYQINAQLAWIAIFIMPIFLLLSKLYINRMRKLTKEVRDIDGQVQAHMQEKLQHKVLIQTLDQNKPIINKLYTLQASLFTQVMKRANFTVFSRTLVMAGFAAGYVIAFLWGVTGIYDGIITFGTMTAFLQLMNQIQRPMVELSSYIPSLVHTITSAERLKELDDLPLEQQGEQLKLEYKTGIRLENVSFSYPDGDKPVIANFSFDFKPQSKTAIVGETGAGKSTLIRLILALLHPQNGKIFIYDTDQRIEVSPLTRCNLVYVPQGNTLLSGTIKENLLLGKLDATDEQIQKVLHAAVADFVYNLPDGLNTICGERGVGLSEGQAQRICIARGLLRPGNILLLDEFSSSLDKETERLLMERLFAQSQEKTLIFITHREMITEYCEQIINLNR